MDKAPKQLSEDLSMEDVLASIRRIVTEEGHESAVKPVQSALRPDAQDVSDDVIELRNALHEDAAPSGFQDQEEPLAAPKSGENTSPEAPIAENFAPPQEQPQALPQQRNKNTTEAITQLVQAAVQQSLTVQQSHTSLENFLHDIIKPHLEALLAQHFETTLQALIKNWLDQNLPALAEARVNDAIHRIQVAVQRILQQQDF